MKKLLQESLFHIQYGRSHYLLSTLSSLLEQLLNSLDRTIHAHDQMEHETGDQNTALDGIIV